jgi:hypothetical protein
MKNVEGSGPRLIEGTIPVFALNDWGKPLGTSVMVVGLRDKIWSRYLQNTMVECWALDCYLRWWWWWWWLGMRVWIDGLHMKYCFEWAPLSGAGVSVPWCGANGSSSDIHVERCLLTSCDGFPILQYKISRSSWHTILLGVAARNTKSAYLLCV